jgi:hypothetical protein
VIGLYLLLALGAVALLAYLVSRYREYTDPDVELGAVRHSAVIVLTSCLVLAFVFTFVAPVFTDRTEDSKYSLEPLPHPYSISGRVLDSSGTPIGGALVRATGPLFVPAVARNYETVSNANGNFRLDLLVGGGYNLYVTALGFEPTFLVSRLELADVTGDMSVPIMLRRRSEIQVQVGPALIGPAQDPENSIYPRSGGISRADIPVLLMSHGIIASSDEIANMDETVLSGPDWITYLRDGESIYPVTTWLFNEPVCRITFVSFHVGRPQTLYVLLRTGGVAYQLDDTPDTVFDDAPMATASQEPQQADEPPDDSQSPEAAEQISREPASQPQQTTTSAPLRPTTTLPPVAPPVVSLAVPPPQSASQPLIMPVPATLPPPTNTGQLVLPVAIPQIQQSLPPVTVPQIQQTLPPIQQSLPPAQQALPPIQQTLPPIQPALPPIQQALPPIQQALPPISVPKLPAIQPQVTVPSTLPSVPLVPLPKLP